MRHGIAEPSKHQHETPARPREDTCGASSYGNMREVKVTIGKTWATCSTSVNKQHVLLSRPRLEASEYSALRLPCTRQTHMRFAGSYLIVC